MGFFDFLKGPDINQGVKEYSTTDGAVLLDVRTPDEYRQGHIPGSKTAKSNVHDINKRNLLHPGVPLTYFYF